MHDLVLVDSTKGLYHSLSVYFAEYYVQNEVEILVPFIELLGTVDVAELHEKLDKPDVLADLTAVARDNVEHSTFTTVV